MELTTLNKDKLITRQATQIDRFIESSAPSLPKKILTSLTQTITQEKGEIYLVGNRLVTSLGPRIEVEDLKLEAQMLLEEIESRPVFKDRAQLGNLIQISETKYASSLAIVRRDDTDFMIGNLTLEELYKIFSKNIPEENFTLHSSANEPDFMLLEITDPENSNGVITFFAPNHPASFREERGVNIDLLKSELIFNSNHIILDESQEVKQFKNHPVLKLINIGNLSSESQLAADIATRFLRHATTIRIDGQPIKIDIDKSQLDFLIESITNQYVKFWNSEDPRNFRRLYELGVANIALRKNQEMFLSSHLVNVILYKAMINSFILAGTKAAN